MQAENPAKLLSPKAAHQINDETYEQNEAQSTAADGRPADVKAAAAEQQNEDKD